MAHEYFDVLDENGNITGEIKLRDEVHRDGDWHHTVHVWLVNNQGELLIQRISPDKKDFANLWGISAAGHISAGEKPNDVAVRELEEELGLSRDFSYFEKIGVVKRSATISEVFVDNEFNHIYCVQTEIDPENLKLQEDEVAEVKFIHYQELAERVTNNDQTLIIYPENFEILFKYLYQKFGN